MVPERIKAYFLPGGEKRDGDDTILRGQLVCCGQHSFFMRTVGTVLRTPFRGMTLYPGEEGLALTAICSTCGRYILVFDTAADGYANCFAAKAGSPLLPVQPVRCPKCDGESFSVNLKYEYPDEQELADLGCEQPGKCLHLDMGLPDLRRVRKKAYGFHQL